MKASSGRSNILDFRAHPIRGITVYCVERVFRQADT